MQPPNRILVVDDEAKLRRILVRMLAAEGYEVEGVETGEQAVELTSTFLPDVVLMDQNLPGISGQEATARLVEQVSGIKVIMITAFATVDRAVDAMRCGACDYLTKPFDNDELLLRVQRAMEIQRLSRQVESLQIALGERYTFERIVGESPLLLAALDVGRRAAQTEVAILIEGESGTGKELLVRAIHHASSRGNGPFVAVNCAAVPADLVESEFFGHEKGAFTGAGASHTGRFEQANGGTLFLDEISEMPIHLQAKLLRALEEGEISRVGGNEPIPIDVRVIAATNRNAREAVDEGELREDLYHRLAVIGIRIPPLRERREDIPLLARHFLAQARQEGSTRGRDFSTDTWAGLEAYTWPGNARELRNAVQRAGIMAEEEIIRTCDLPPVVQTARPIAPVSSLENQTLEQAVNVLERQMLVAALDVEGGNKTRAAERLGITRKTLAAKMVHYGL
jgi:two-component system, NtrC family, response regulator AtoC